MAGKVATVGRQDGEAAVELLLRRLVASIEPTASQKAGAQRSHSYLRDLLDSGQMRARIVNSYLSGSYARDTAIRPLDDVDVIFEIDPSSWSSGFFSSSPAPERVLESFAAAIRRRYEFSSVYSQRRSVRLKLYHLDIDVVPAIPLTPESDVILVPDRDAGDWIKSSPRRHSDNSTRLNKCRNGKFKPLVKLAKWWNSNLPESARCKSFMIETMAVRIFAKTHFYTLGDGLLLFWDFLAAQYGEPVLAQWPDHFGMSFSWLKIAVPDTAGTGSNTAAHVDDARARGLSTKARISRDRLLAAYDAHFDNTLEQHVRDALRA